MRYSVCLSLSYTLSLPISLPTPPSCFSSRNWSGSGSCRSMEIWVRTVYVIIASINALLICSGLQPSIDIIHPHARASPNCCFTHSCRHTLAHNKKREREREIEKNPNYEKTSWERERIWKDNKLNRSPLPCLCSTSVTDHQGIDRL